MLTGVPSDQGFEGVTATDQRPFASFALHTVFTGAIATEQEPVTVLLPDTPRSAYVVGSPAATKVAVTDFEALLIVQVTLGAEGDVC